MGFLALLIWLPFFRSMLRRMFLLPYAYYMWLSSIVFAFLLSFVALFLLLSPLLATMSFAGYFHVRFVLSAFFPVCFDLFSPTVLVPGLFWCNSIYLVTTAGFVADS